MSNKDNPVNPSERHIILDALRGIALLGICLANYPEFSLYTFQGKEIVEAMPTAGIDNVWRYFHYIFIDGKFYSLFSLLFGIGFSIIISNITKKNQNVYTIFYRRMFILALIGFLHLLFLWAGDILLLYALVGFLLPFFRNISNRKLLIIAVILIFLPIAMDIFKVLTDYKYSLLVPVEKAIAYFNLQNGINKENFGIWLLNGMHYSDIVKFNIPGSFIRCQEFIEANRAVKVLGLFILGLYIGRNKIYAHLDEYKSLLKKVRNYGFLIGLPVSCFFAWNEINGHPTGAIVSSIVYAFCVVPMSLAYISAICLWYIKHRDMKFFKIIAAPGRMALTNYIMQSVIGIIIFYGIGFKLALIGLIYVEMIAAAAFVFQILYSNLWLRYFQYGPLEWIWRIFTYGKFIKLKTKN